MTGRGWAARYGALVRSAWLADLQYRAALFLWIVVGVSQPLVALAIWWSIAGEGEVSGYGRADFARYFLAVMLVDQLTAAWDIWYIDRWIRFGGLNLRLARPIDPIHEAIAGNLAHKLKSGAVIACVWAGAALAWPAVRPSASAWVWGMAAVAVALAAAIRFLVTYVNGLLAFWTTRATAIAELNFAVTLFLGGRIAPLALLPPAVAGVASVLWFSYTLAFPVGVLTGEVASAAEFARGLAWQCGWLAFWLAAYRVVWTRGVRRYGAVGG